MRQIFHASSIAIQMQSSCTQPKKRRRTWVLAFPLKCESMSNTSSSHATARCEHRAHMVDGLTTLPLSFLIPPPGHKGARVGQAAIPNPQLREKN